MSSDLKQQLKDRASKFNYFSISIYETVHIKVIEHLAVFVRACDRDFHVYGELVELIPIHDATRSQYIFQTLEQVLHDYGFDLSKLACLSTDDADNIF